MPTSGHARRLLGSGAIYVVTSLLQGGAALLLLPALARLLTPEAFGLVTLANSTTRFLVMVVALGLPTAVLRFHYLDHHGSAASHNLTHVAPLLATGLITLVSATGVLWMPWFESSVDAQTVFQVAVWSAVPLVFLQAVQSRLRVLHRPVQFAVLTIAFTVGARLAGILILLPAANTALVHVSTLAVGYVVCGVLASALLGAPRFIADPVPIRSALRFSVPLVPHSLAMTGLILFDRFLVERWVGLEHVGRYHVAYSLGAVVLILGGALNNAWLPSLLEKRGAERAVYLRHTESLLLRLLLATILLIALSAPVLLRLLLPAQYRPTDLLPITILISLSGVPYLYYLIGQNTLLERQRTGPLGWASGGALAVNGALNVILLPRWGLLGAAVATVASYTALALALQRISSRREHGHRLAIWNLPFLLPTSLTAVVCSMLMLDSLLWRAASRTAAVLLLAWLLSQMLQGLLGKRG